MFDLRRAVVFAALLSTTIVVVSACGGATASSPAGATTEPGATAEASAAASEVPAATETAGASVGALPTFDLGALTGALPGVDSYRTSLSISGVEQYQSVVVTQPVLSKAITVFDDGDVSQRFVIIGDEAWTASGSDGGFESVPAELASSMLIAFDPTFMLGGFAAVDWAGSASDQGVEEKNGVQARHLRIDSTTFVGAAAQMPAGSAIDVWVADAGYLVAWEMSGFPEDANISIQVTAVNDPANKVERPS